MVPPLTTPPTTPAPRRSALRRVARALGIGLVGLAGLLALAGIVLGYLLTPAELTPRLEGLLRDLFRGTPHLGRVEWQPPLGVRVDDFTLSSTSGAQVLRAGRVEAWIDPRTLRGGEVRLLRARVRDVDVTLSRPSRTRPYDLVYAFLPRAESPPDAPPSELQVILGDVELRDVDVVVREPGLDVAVRGATVTAGQLTRDVRGVRLSLDVAARHVHVAQAGLPVLDGAATAERVGVVWTATSGAARLDLGAARLELDGPPRAVLTARGRLAPLATDAPILALLDVTVDAALAHPTARALIDTYVPASVPVATTGTVTATARLTGVVTTPTVAGTVRLLGVEVAHVAWPEVVVEGEASSQHARADLLVLRLADGAIRGRAAYHVPTRAVVLDAELEAVALAPWTVDARLPSHVRGHLTASGTLASLAVTAALRGGTARALATGAAPVRLAVDGALSCAEPGCTVGGPRTAVALGVELDHGALGPLVRARVPEASASRGTARLRLSGHLDHLGARGVVRVEGVRHAALPLTMALEVPLALDGPELQLLDATLTASIGVVLVRGTVRLPRQAGAATSSPTVALDVLTDGLALGPLTGGRGRGRLAVRARLDGPLAAPTARAEGLLTALAYHDQPVADVLPFVLTARAGRYTLARTQLALVGGGTLTLEGASDGEDLDVRAFGEAVPLATLATLGGLSSTTAAQLDGTLELAVGARGSRASPTLDVEVEGQALGLLGVAFDRATLRAEGPTSALRFDLRLVGQGGTVKLGGAIDVGAQRLRPTELLVRNLALPRLAALPTLAGRIDAELALVGPLPYPEARGHVGLRDLSLAERPLGLDLTTLEIAPAGDDGLYTLALALGRGLVVRGLLALAPAFGFTAFAEARDWSLRPVIEALIARGTLAEEGLVRTLAVTIGGTADVAYDARGPRVDVRLSALDVGAAELGLALEAPAALAYDGETLTVGRLVLSGRRGGLEVAGTVGAQVSLDARADVNAALLALASRTVQSATGRFTVEASARGPREDPDVSATLSIGEPVSIRPRMGVREVVLEAGRVVATRTRVDIEGLTGELGGGTFRLVGSVGLRNNRPRDFELAFDGQSLPLRTRDLAVEASTALRLRGSAEAPRLSGRLELERARYAKKFRLENFAFVAQSTDEGPTLAEQLPWLSELELDVRAQSAGDIDVDVDASTVQLGLALGADVTVRGSPLAPRLGGRLRSDAGSLVFPRATLDVTTCTVDLDPYPAAGTSGMTVRLVAEGEVTGTDKSRTRVVRVVLEGPLEQLSLDLQSAGLDRLQVLSLLILGSDAPEGNDALAFAGSQLAAPLTRFLEDQLEKSLNLGVKLGAEVSQESVKVTATKELTRRLVLEGSYERYFADDVATTAVRALLYLFDRAFLEARASQTTGTATGNRKTAAGEATSTGVELKYQLLGR